MSKKLPPKEFVAKVLVRPGLQVTDQTLHERLAALFSGPAWNRVKRTLWKRSPQRLREFVDSMCEELEKSTTFRPDDSLLLPIRRQRTKLFRILRRIQKRLIPYTESPEELAARRQRPGAERFKLKRPPDRVVDAIRDALALAEQLQSTRKGLAVKRRSLSEFIEQKVSVTARGKAGAKKRPGRYHDQKPKWQAMADKLCAENQKLKDAELHRQIADAFGYPPEFTRDEFARDVIRHNVKGCTK